MTNSCRNLAFVAAILLIHAGVSLSATWTRASTGFTTSIADARVLTIDQSGSNLYVLTEGNSVFRSSDGGATWKLLGGITGALVLGIDQSSASILYAGTIRGVRKSTDGGEGWASAGLDAMPVTVLAVDPVTSSTVYAAAGRHVYKTSDGGVTWTLLNLAVSTVSSVPSVSTIVLDPLSPSTLYAVGGGSAMYKSMDAGESWRIVNAGPFGSLMAADPTNPPTLYALYGSGLSKGTDGGVTWSATGLTRVAPAVMSVGVDPTNGTTRYAGVSGPNQTSQAFYESTDAGQNWIPVNTSLPVASGIVVDPAAPSVIYVVTPGAGLFKSVDAGKTWNDANAALRVHGIETLTADPSDPGTLYVGGAEGLFKSVDRGTSWNRLAEFQVAMGMPPPGATSGPRAWGCSRASDGGASWVKTNDGLGNFDVRAMSLLRGDLPTVLAGTPAGVFTMVDDQP